MCMYVKAVFFVVHGKFHHCPFKLHQSIILLSVHKWTLQSLCIINACHIVGHSALMKYYTFP